MKLQPKPSTDCSESALVLVLSYVKNIGIRRALYTQSGRHVLCNGPVYNGPVCDPFVCGNQVTT